MSDAGRTKYWSCGPQAVFACLSWLPVRRVRSSCRGRQKPCAAFFLCSLPLVLHTTQNPDVSPRIAAHTNKMQLQPLSLTVKARCSGCIALGRPSPLRAVAAGREQFPTLQLAVPAQHAPNSAARETCTLDEMYTARFFSPLPKEV